MTLAVGWGGTGAAVVAAAGTGVPSTIAGLSNFFEGASGGGVASDFILARALSASAGFSLVTQLRSTVTCRIGSPTFRGLCAAREVKIGAMSESTSPRTTGWAAWSCTSYCRSNRKRSIGRRLRPRNSSKFGPSLTIVVLL
jgi:hypothetical protein